MEKLIDIISMRREHGSSGEKAFVAKYLSGSNVTQIKNQKGETIAYMVDNCNPDLNHKVLWSCHIDTMHRGKDEILTQEVWVDEDGLAFVTDKEDCLGADDGAGAWLLLEMIAGGVPGCFVFHRGEEIGCWGSKQIAATLPQWLATFTHALAFDRRANHSVITHQMGSRCCSDNFGKAFAELLKMNHELDPTGSYTDTAQYMEIISECANFSIGYNGEHSHRETLDTTYTLALRDALVAIDWVNTMLPADRDPSIVEYEDYGWNRFAALKSWPYQTGDEPLLNPDEIPSYKDLMECSYQDTEEWIESAGIAATVWLVQDLLDEITNLKSSSKDGYEDVYDYDYGIRRDMQ